MKRGNVIDLARERRRRGPRFDGNLMQILEVSRDMVCLCRGGVITAINGAGAGLLGSTSADRVRGRRLVDFLIPEYGSVIDLFLAGKASEDKAVPTRIIGLDGKTRDVEMQVYRAREIAPDATVVVCRDISHEGRLAGQAVETEARFSKLVENAINLVCHVQDGRVEYLNKAGLKMLGAESGDMLGRPVAELFHGDYAEVFAPEMVDSLVAETAGIPMRLRRLDGQNVDVMVMISRLPSRHGVELMVEARDITAHNRAVQALRQANETLEMRVAQRTRELDEQRALADELRHVAEASRRFSENLLEMIPNPVWFKDARGHFQTCNQAFRETFDCDPTRSPKAESEVQAALPARCPETDAEILAGDMGQAVFEGTVRLTDGSRRDVLVGKCAYMDDDGHVVGILGVMTDITERKSMEQELLRLATTDPLTGAANRRRFMEVASREQERSFRYGHPVSAIMLDIDHFKKINDTHGHAVGDEALKAFAATVQNSLRDLDLMGRLGGEEFAVLLPETGLSGALEVAERLRAAVAAIRLPLSDGGSLAFTVSLGACARLNHDVDFEATLARADEALYRAKQGGRNRVERG